MWLPRWSNKRYSDGVVGSRLLLLLLVLLEGLALAMPTTTTAFALAPTPSGTTSSSSSSCSSSSRRMASLSLQWQPHHHQHYYQPPPQQRQLLRNHASFPRRELRRPSSSRSTATRRYSLPVSIATIIDSTTRTTTLFLHTDPSYCLTAILVSSACGIALERRTVIGKALSAPLATMALTLIVANLGIMPFDSPVYSAINRLAVPLAVPLLLYDSNLRRVLSDTGSLLTAFVVGAVATVIGTLVAFPLVPLTALSSSGSVAAATGAGWKVASALAARHIGGAINFVAVAETLCIPGTIVSAAIAADNVVVALYFAILFALAKEGEDANDNDATTTGIGAAAVMTNTTTTTTTTLEPIIFASKTIETELDYSLDANTTENEISLSTISVSIAVASTLVTIGKILTQAFLPTGTSSLPLTSALTVVAATLVPQFFAHIRMAGTAVGIVLIQMFFAASGAAGSLALVWNQAPSLFCFSALQIAVHFVVLMGLGRGILRLPLNELYLASNANVGGPTTAAAMAQAKLWKRLVLPALLVGILGYATATGIALALGPILVRLPVLGR